MNSKRIFGICVAAMLCFLCSCGPVTPTPMDSPPEEDGGKLAGSSAGMKIEAVTPPPVRYTVSFDENGDFPDELSRAAAEHIDPSVQRAVELMNTLEEGDRYAVLDCDYSQRPTRRSGITDPAALAIYDTYVEKASAFEDYIFDESSYETEDFYLSYVTAYEALVVDHKELLMYCDLYSDNSLAYYRPGDWLDSLCEDRETVKNEVLLYHRVVDRILEKMPEGLSNYEKCCYFAFVIAAAAEYDYRLRSLPNPFQAYDALVNGSAVCQGYAQAFYWLCRMEGISCWYCTGTATSDSGPHAWNLIDTEEGTLYMDLTWYDDEEIGNHYRDGDFSHLFKTQEDGEYDNYIQASIS